MPFSISSARTNFLALRQSQIFMDNAGGTQTLDTVADSIATYLKSTNVQLGATYPISSASTAAVQEGYDLSAKYINAESFTDVVLGGSTTQLFANLTDALWSYLTPGSEIVLSQLDHEANVASWVRVAERRGLSIKWWKGDFDAQGNRFDPKHTPESLIPLLSEKTRFVACTHTSNILGTIHDIAALSKTIRQHAPDALFCVDGVAFAPHRAVDVRALDVDFYCFSWYKVYGPHIALLYAAKTAQEKMDTLGHYFKGKADDQSLETRLGLAAGNYELSASIRHITEYLTPKEEVWEEIARHEENLSRLVLKFLSQDERIQVVGSPRPDKEVRVPVISFLVKGWKSFDIVLEVEKRSHYGIRAGHFYTHRLVDGLLGLGEDGVVRISLVHYNTVGEVQGLLEVLAEILKK